MWLPCQGLDTQLLPMMSSCPVTGTGHRGPGVKGSQEHRQSPPSCSPAPGNLLSHVPGRQGEGTQDTLPAAHVTVPHARARTMRNRVSV